ncbi:MAG TPA: hypothetical protein VFG23_05610 [Polyangia bacterium]|nr:hypothetical protein [Polyangia bacterium]
MITDPVPRAEARRRGFFTRIDHLYHHALGTPPAARGPLRWIKRGAVFAIDWRRLSRR